MAATDIHALADELVAIGFGCRRCGDCCRGLGTDGSLVMVGRDEIERIEAAHPGPKDGVAEPYPDEVLVRGTRCRLGWALQRDETGACRLLEGDRCLVYDARPRLCRTYPFMLDEDRLLVSECPGLGQPLSEEDALDLARELIDRRAAEEDEARAIREILVSTPLPAEALVVIDAGGVTRL